jgi:4-hydroxy-tetrahydrodipicolinate reductase
MNIAIIGYGQMGHKIEEFALQRNMNIIARIDPNNKLADHYGIKEEVVREADVCIDFSHPQSVINNIRELALLGKNMVIGTTGWYENRDAVEKIVRDSNIGFIYASNFSLGMNLFYKIIESTSEIFNNFIEYDVTGIEMHHNKKADSPSGTAKTLSKIIINNISRKTKALYGISLGKIESDEFQFSSIRCGSIPGNHQIIFDSPQDTIEISHSARNRDGFATGALLAAEWIKDKKGFYSFDHLINNLIKNKKEL